jgi:exopolyphosphatase/guanosine-5'-triphosphate,3'-diphosphate pyrophosphatase
MDAWRLATMDVGSNTVLLLVTEILGNRVHRVLEDHAQITRLGESVGHRGRLTPQAQQRTLDVLGGYSERCKELGVREIKVAGTSALREAKNARDFIDRVQQELGLELRVLTSQEEAQLSYQAVGMGLSLQVRDLLVVDVGGGSTEFIWGRQGELYRWVSLPVGTVKLTERFLHTDPSQENETNQLVKAIDQELGRTFRDWCTEAAFDAMVGVAGTFTTLGAVKKALLEYRSEQIHGYDLERAEVQRQIQLYKGLPLEERKAIPGLEPKRADVILAGAVLVDRIMDHFQQTRVTLSDQGIRYGLLYERLGGV